MLFHWFMQEPMEQCAATNCLYTVETELSSAHKIKTASSRLVYLIAIFSNTLQIIPFGVIQMMN